MPGILGLYDTATNVNNMDETTRSEVFNEVIDQINHAFGDLDQMMLDGLSGDGPLEKSPRAAPAANDTIQYVAVAHATGLLLADVGSVKIRGQRWQGGQMMQARDLRFRYPRHR